MKKQLLFFCMMLIVWNATHAATRRVGYTATVQPVSGLDYGNFQAAHDASANGDTIQLYPGSTGSVSYTGTISKQLVIIGPGYFTNTYYVSGQNIPNTALQNLPGNISSCSFNIDLGSAGSVIQGLNNITVTTVNRVDVLNNISISRCQQLNVNFANSGNCDGWSISQCYGVTVSQNGASGSFTGNRTITNLLLQNSVIAGAISFNTSPSGTYSGNKIVNCIFPSGTSLSTSGAAFLVQNCIFDNPSVSGAASVVFTKNISSQPSGTAGINNTGNNSGNQFSISINGLFTGYPLNPVASGFYTYSQDGQFQLTTNSVAKNAGYLPGTTTATDCGIFGGAKPYVLSGIPPIPIFNKLSSSSAIINGASYTMSFSVSSNN